MAREILLQTPLGEDRLHVLRFTGFEALGRLFLYDLELESADEAIVFEDLLGLPVTMSLETSDQSLRYFNGIVSRFAQIGRSQGGYAVYQLRMQPWFWLLTRTSDCRIFQQLTVPEIIKSVFSEAGFNDFEDTLTGSYAKREYCVQYRETDFEFLSRLMEHEGIYYFFTHEDGKHTLVLADAYSAHGPLPGGAELPYHLPDLGETVGQEHVSHWQLSANLQPGSVALADFNFKMPQNKLRVNRLIQRPHAQADFEIYDYPGFYPEASQGEATALHRIEEFHTEYAQVQAESDARALYCGGLFNLLDHPREDQNKEYLVIETRYHIATSSLASGAGSGDLVYQNVFRAIDAKTPFRPARTTRKPLIHGPHTATVVGPAGEEIYPDEYARVKVQFHWDRYGEHNESSSCWVRVSQTWAGPGMGCIHIPRIGQEVIIDFAEGDVDRPIITGRLYNADNMPPYALPANKTQSGIKSRSSPGGGAGNCNEIRLEDKSGSEELYIQAEKDENILVKNDKSETVGHDETTSIGNDQTLTVGNNQDSTIGNNQTLSVGVDQTETVGSNQTISVGADQSETVGANRTESVGANETLSVGGSRSRSVGGSESVSVSASRTHTVAVNETIGIGAAQEIGIGGLQVIGVGAAQTINVGAVQSISVGGSQSIDVGAGQSVSTGAGQTISVGADRNVDVSGNESVKVGSAHTLKAGTNVVIEAGDAITLKCGSASISMKKNGDIVIKGKDLTLKGSGKINVTASNNITMKGQKILQN